MTTLNIEDLQPDLTHLIDQAVQGETLIITREGKPIARLEAFTPSTQTKASKRIGALAGRFTIPDDFDHFMQAEMIEVFEGQHKSDDRKL